jgi:hypothetical protein
MSSPWYYQFLQPADVRGNTPGCTVREAVDPRRGGEGMHRT